MFTDATFIISPCCFSSRVLLCELPLWVRLKFEKSCATKNELQCVLTANFCTRRMNCATYTAVFVRCAAFFFFFKWKIKNTFHWNIYQLIWVHIRPHLGLDPMLCLLETPIAEASHLCEWNHSLFILLWMMTCLCAKLHTLFSAKQYQKSQRENRIVTTLQICTWKHPKQPEFCPKKYDPYISLKQMPSS